MKGWAAEGFLKKKKSGTVLENNCHLSLPESFWYLFNFEELGSKQFTFIFHFLRSVGMKGWREGMRKDQAWICTQSRSATRAGVDESCLKAAAAGLELMPKVIWHARRKGDKRVGFAAPFICAHTHTFLIDQIQPFLSQLVSLREDSEGC